MAVWTIYELTFQNRRYIGVSGSTLATRIATLILYAQRRTRRHRGPMHEAMRAAGTGIFADVKIIALACSRSRANGLKIAALMMRDRGTRYPAGWNSVVASTQYLARWWPNASGFPYYEERSPTLASPPPEEIIMLPWGKPSRDRIAEAICSQRGMSVTYLSRTYGISRPTVYDIWRRAGLWPPR